MSPVGKVSGCWIKEASMIDIDIAPALQIVDGLGLHFSVTFPSLEYG
jgi:hypothetical protein